MSRLRSVEVDAALVRDGRQVQHGVGGAAERHVHGERVAERVLGHDVTRLDVLFEQLHNFHACLFAELDSLGIDSRNGAVAAQTHAQHFGEAVHGIGGVHAGAAAAAGAGFVFVFVELVKRELAGVVGANRLKHTGKAGLVAGKTACQHRTAANKNCRNIQSCRCHKKSWNIFITVRNHDQCIKRMSDRHCFC